MTLPAFRRFRSALLLAAGTFALSSPAVAQRVVSQPQQVISVSRGASALLVNPVAIQRITIGDPGIADANVVSATEVVVNGKVLGSTTLLVWDNSGAPRIYSVEVTADAQAIQRFIKGVMPDENIEVSSSGNTVTLSGTVRDAVSASRAVEIARTSGATVIENLFTPPAVQVLLQVRFAEISRSIMKDWSSSLSTVNPHKVDTDGATWVGQTTPEGQIGFLIDDGDGSFEAIIQAAKTRGDFRSLAEPNLMVLPGREAYFLAGGEFPFPTLQAASAGNVVTVVFKEFGIKLRFTPVILRSGAIRLTLKPEVSSLDFANGLVIGGFEIPTILTRRAETEVELREGQYLAIAGLLDNSLINNVTKIPILGDIPLLGELFKSRAIRQRKTELLVLITPKLVVANERPTPLPTGEPSRDWRMDGFITRPAVPGAATQQQPSPPAAQPPRQQ